MFNATEIMKSYDVVNCRAEKYEIKKHKTKQARGERKGKAEMGRNKHLK